MNIKDLTTGIAGSTPARALFALFFAVSAGYSIGTAAGSGLVRSYVHGDRPVYLLLYRPARDISIIYKRVNSPDEIDRLHGYYAMLDNNIADASFLIERYRAEASPYIRRSIIWILGCAGNSDETYMFFSDIYRDNGEIIRREIVRAVKRMGKGRYKSFREEQGISADTVD